MNPTPSATFQNNDSWHFTAVVIRERESEMGTQTGTDGVPGDHTTGAPVPREAEAAAAAAAAAIFLAPLVRMPTPRDDIVTEAQAQGITSTALRAVCRELGVTEYTLHGRHVRLWGLPGIERFGGGFIRLGAAMPYQEFRASPLMLVAGWLGALPSPTLTSMRSPSRFPVHRMRGWPSWRESP